MNLRFIVIPHKLEAFIGSEWRSTKTGRWTKAGARDISDLANARVPKYTASILFLEVIAYILGRNHISQSTDTDKRDAPQHNEDVRRKQEEREQDRRGVVSSNAPGSGDDISTKPPGKYQSDLSHSLWTNSVRTRPGTVCCVKTSCFWTNLGFPPTTQIVNLPELVPDEEDPILSIAMQVTSGILRGR